jgi:hypothetical protein
LDSEKVLSATSRSGEPTLRINTGKYDPLLGRSYFEIAMHARSQHRSQEQGVLELKGDQFSNLTLVSQTSDAPVKEVGVFDSIDVSTGDPSNLMNLDAGQPGPIISELKRLLPDSQDDPKYPIVADAILRVAGVRIDVLAERETAIPGESFPVVIRVFTPYPDLLQVEDISLPKTSEPATESSTPSRRETANYTAYRTITAGGLTQPFWLWERRKGDLFQISRGSPLLLRFRLPTQGSGSRLQQDEESGLLSYGPSNIDLPTTSAVRFAAM